MTNNTITDLNENAVQPISLDAEDMPEVQSQSRPTITATQLQEMLQYIIQNIVSEKGAVKVTVTSESIGSSEAFIEVASGDKGRVIGKRGRTIKAIRDLVGIFGRIHVTLKE